MVEAVTLEKHPRTGDRAPGWKAVMADPALVALHHVKAAHHAWMDYSGPDEDMANALCHSQARAFWKMVDTKPHTMIAAIETARFMLELHKEEVCPTVREEDIGKDAGEVEHDIPAIALERLLAAFGENPAVDPAIEAANRLWAAKAEWSGIQDAQIGTPAEKRAERGFQEALAELLKVVPTSAMGAGMMAQVLVWNGFTDAVSKCDLRGGLSAIERAFAPSREELLIDEEPELPASNLVA